MTISRGQMKRQLRMGGGIMNLSKEGIGGGIIKGVDMGSRAGFFNPVKAVKGAVKGVAKTVGKIAKSPIGKAALLYAGTAGLGALGAGAARATTGFGGIFNPSNVMSNLGASFLNFKSTPFGEKIFGTALGDTDLKRSGGIFSKAFDKIGGGGGITKLATLGLVSKFLTDTLGMPQEQAEAELARDPSGYLEQYYRNLNPPGNKDPETYEAEVAAFVTANTSEYAVGGRVGFAEGKSGIMKMASAILGDESDDISMQLFGKPVKDLNPDEFKELMDEIDRLMNKFRAKGPVLPPDPTQPVNPFGPKPGDFGIEEDIPIKAAMGGRMGFDEGTPKEGVESLLRLTPEPLVEEDMVVIITQDEDGNPKLIQVPKSQIEKESGIKMPRSMKAKGDTASMNAMQAAGVEGLPVRQNKAGVKELDLRETGGFIPPVGIKEKADDIPAMLSNNEFVMTADAVRGMGGGNVELGAQRMYDQMKMLEAGGKV